MNEFPKKGKTDNHLSHFYGSVEGVTRCLSCDVAGWNGWKEKCPNVIMPMKEWVGNKR